MTRLKHRLFQGLSVGICLLASPLAAQQQAGPMSVSAMVVERESVPKRAVLPGRAVAGSQTEIMPRVTGMIEEILYMPGIQLEKNAPLFRMDTQSYEAELARAQANLVKAEAAIPLKESALVRARKLQGSSSTSVQLDVAQAELAQAEAEVSAAKASLELAQTTLEWTEIKSPIAGIASIASVSEGDLVSPAQARPLTVITQLDPIEVELLEPSRTILELREQLSNGTVKKYDELKVTLTLEDGKEYVGAGKLVAPGVAVSTSTGTVDFRFSFENPNGVILPGMFLRGEVEFGTIDGVLVPQRAASRDGSGQLTAWFVKDGKAERRDLESVGVYRNSWIVADGIADGDTLILDGLAQLQPGADVTVVPARVTETGLIEPIQDGSVDPAAGKAE